MKRVFQILMIFALPAFLAACPDKDRSNDKDATTPLTTDCLNGQTNCYSEMYQHFPGFFPYPGNYGTYGGYLNYWATYYGYQSSHLQFCACGPNAFPVYHNQLGLGCVQNQALAPIAGFTGYWNLPSVNNHWTSLPQNSNLNPGNSFSACKNSVIQACFLNQPNTCVGGQVCRPVANNSALGVCAWN